MRGGIFALPSVLRPGCTRSGGDVLSFRDHILAELRAHLLAEDPSLSPEALPPEASLTAGLGLDSGRLASLFAMVRARISDRDLTPWLIQAARRGQDTLGGLADFLALDPIPPRAREK